MKKLGSVILQLFIILFFGSVVVYAMINYSSFAPLLWFVFWFVLGYAINKIAFRDVTNAKNYSRRAYMIGYILLGIGMVFYFLKGGTPKSDTFPFVLVILLMYAVSPISIRLVGLENINYIKDLKDLTRLILAALISLAVGLAVLLLVFNVIG